MKLDLSEFVDAAVAGSSKTSAKLTVQNAGLAAAAGVKIGATASFCQLWPTVKGGLDLLKNIVPIWAKWVIDAVIAIGDKLCP